MSDDAPFAPPPVAPRRRSRTAMLVLSVVAVAAGVLLAVIAIRQSPWIARTIAPAAVAPAAVAAPAAPSPDMTTLSTRETALAAQLASLEARTTTLGTDAAAAGDRASRAEAILVAFAARRALDRGLGLGYLEQQLRIRFGAAAPREVAEVATAARRPVTLEDLRESLDAAAPSLLAGEDDWWAGIGSELRNLAVIHRTGTPSPLPADRLARARRMLTAGNVEAARGEVARLPGAQRAGGWTEAAGRYVAARRALDTIETFAIIGPVAGAGTQTISRSGPR